MAQKAAGSRYLYCSRVPFSTRYTVMERTKRAPIPRPMAMSQNLLVMAKAATTPSKEKLLSSTSR